MTKQQILEMTGLSEKEFYNKYPDQQSFMMEYGGMVEEYKKGGWIQKATASIKRRGTEGKCTPMSKPGCTGRALALAKTFHKMAAKRKKKEEGGYVDMYEDGGDTNPLLNIPESQRFPPVSESKLNPSVPLNFMGQPFATGAIEESISPLDFIGGVRGGVGLVKGLMKYRKAMKPNYIQIGDELFDMGPHPRAVRRATKQMHKGAQQLVLPNIFEDGGKIPDNVLRARLESHMSPGEAQDYIDSYAQGGVVDVYQLMGMPTPAMYGMGGTTNIGDLSHVISAKNFPNMGYAMGGQVNGPNLLQVDRGNMPIFAEGDMPEKETMSLKDKYNKWLNAKPTTKYASGGMPPHPEIGMDPSGTVPTKSGDINVEKGESMWNVGNSQFIGTKAKTEAMLKDYNNRDLIALASKFNAIEINKAKNEAKEQQLAAMQEQKAQRAMTRMMGKYGGAIQRMMARGGMVPMYQGGGNAPGPRADSGYFNFDAFGMGPSPNTTYGGFNTMQNPLPGINNYLGQFNSSTPAYNVPGGIYPNQTPYRVEPADSWRTGPTNPVTGVSNYLSTMGQQAVDATNAARLNNKDVTIPTYARSGVDADGNPVSINPNMPSGYIPPGYEAKGGADMSNMNKYLPYAMQAAPVLYNLAQGLRKPTKIPGTLGNMPTDLQAPKLLGNAGRRALARESALGRYAWRQAGAQAGPAALTAMTNARMARSADYEEKLRNAQAQMDYQAAAQRKAYEQFNAQQAMNRYMLQAQADAVPTQYMSSSMGQLGQMGENILNRQMLKELYG